MSKLISQWSRDMDRRITHQSNLCPVFSPLQNPHPNWCIFATVLEVWQIPCRRTLFQQFVNNDAQLPKLPHWLHRASIISDSLQTQIDDSPRGLGLDCRAVYEKVPKQSSKFSPCTYDQYGVVCHVSEWYFSSLSIGYAVHDEASEALEGN